MLISDHGTESRPGHHRSRLLDVSGLVVGYGATAVVHGVDLHVDAGEVVALLGANGAGKTTTIMALAGVLPPKEGVVELFGERSAGALHERIQNGLGLLTEQRAIIPSLTPRQDWRLAGVDVSRALALFPDLSKHLDRKAGLLSGGQQQMLALGRALGRAPRLLLCDELSLGLAPIVVDRLLEQVRAAADEGVGVLLVEQHIHRALEVADRVYVMRKGAIDWSGPASEFAASGAGGA